MLFRSRTILYCKRNDPRILKSCLYTLLILLTSLYSIVAGVTGGYTEAVQIRFSRLGIQHIYMRSAVKVHDFKDFMEKTGLSPEHIMYAGDDIPDYEVMTRVGLPVAPADAAPEIKEIAKYISSRRGGEGVARDVIEQTMRAQGHWFGEEAFGW